MHNILRPRNVVQCKTLVRKNPIPDHIGANEKAHEVGIRNCMIGPMLNEPVLCPDQFTTMPQTSAKGIHWVVGTHPS